MTIRLSSGMRDAVVTDYGIGYLLSSGYIRVYTGEQPENADMAPTGTRIGYITQRGQVGEPPYANDVRCLQMALHGLVGSIHNVNPWDLHAQLDGVPGWWRFCVTPEDEDNFSTTRCRVDGSVGDSFARFPAQIQRGIQYPIEGFLLTLPSQ